MFYFWYYWIFLNISCFINKIVKIFLNFDFLITKISNHLSISKTDFFNLLFTKFNLFFSFFYRNVISFLLHLIFLYNHRLNFLIIIFLFDLLTWVILLFFLHHNLFFAFVLFIYLIIFFFQQVPTLNYSFFY